MCGSKPSRESILEDGSNVRNMKFCYLQAKMLCKTHGHNCCSCAIRMVSVTLINSAQGICSVQAVGPPCGIKTFMCFSVTLIYKILCIVVEHLCSK